MIKFKHPLDTKSFIIGVCASITAVVLWDVLKYRNRMLEFKNKDNE